MIFWNNRLYNLSIEFKSSERVNIENKLNHIYGNGTLNGYDSSNMYLSWGNSIKSIFIIDLIDIFSVNFSDEKQKEFHVADLFQGILFYLIVVIVGLFVVYWFIVWMVNSYCKNCKTFNMKYQEISLENPTDYSHVDGVQVFFERPEMHYDKVNKFKCNKCGTARNDRYGSWWSWRNKHK